MKAKLKMLWGIFGVPSIVFHELSHVLMCIIVGAKLKGMKIDCRITADGQIKLSGNVYHSSNNIQLLLISVAPTLFWLAVYVFSIICHWYLAMTYFCLYASYFQSSNGDWRQVKSCFGYTERLHVTNEEYESLMNKED